MGNPHPENEYLDLIRTILAKGQPRADRTGTGTVGIFGHQMRFDISQAVHGVPLLTTKFVPWKMVIKELLWFLRGQTDATLLQEQGVHIWDLNSTREFLDKRGLTDYPEGDVGALYGFQWRHFGADYKTCKDDYTGQGFDQLEYVLNELKTDPWSRRIMLSVWNPPAFEKMSILPCHVSAQFYVSLEDPADPNSTKQLSCHMYQRSMDVALGAPFNIFSYTVLTHILAKKCGMRPHELVISTGDTHLYQNHLEAVKTQLEREPYDFPRLEVSDDVAHKAWEDITLDDFKVTDYKYHPAIKMDMSA